MTHYGDVTKISGACVPPVDVIIGGSPCQDLSIAGKREGLAGTESRLFLEQIRLIKEIKACAGILRRAKRRGRELLPELKLALEMQSQSENGLDKREGGRDLLSK